MTLSIKQKDFLKNYLFYFIAWSLVTFLLIIVRYYDINQPLGIQDPYFNWTKQITETLLVIIVLSFVYVLLEPLISRKKWKRLSLLPVIILRSLFYFAILFFAFSALTFLENLTQSEFDLSVTWDRYFEVLSGKRFQMIMIYLGVSNVLIQSVKLGTRLLGESVFWSYLRGKYFKPVEEDRIFMFLDLKDSTTIAEKLGPLQFSEFLQRFYYDISFPIKNHQANIYQYVGDEVVLYWTMSKGIESENCLQCFFAIQEQITSKKKNYEERFGIVPQFKAAIHSGRVVTAEIGNFKSEIAFHGDVLNTTSRIMAKCNELGADLLISGDLKDKITGLSNFLIEKEGKYILKGKQEETDIYSVNIK